MTRLDGTTPLTIPVALTGAGPGSLTTATGELAAPEEPGSYEVRLRYLSDDARFADAAATRTVTVAKAATATSLAVDPSPGPSGTEWRLTSTTARVSAGTGDPTGWVEFSATVPGRGVVWSSTVPLDAATGLARADVGAATEALPPGTVTFRARYAGDPARHGSEATRDVTVEPRAATPAVPRVPAPEPTPDGADAGAPPGATGGGSDAGGAGGGASPVAEPRDDVRAPVAVSLPLIAAGGLGLAALLVLLVLLRRRRRRTA